MAGLNHVILMGNLTRDPEMKFTSAGKPLATFGIAVNRVPYTNEDGQRIEGVDFFNVVVHGRQAETVNQYLKKGSGVAVDGKLRYRAWQTDDGQKRSAVDVVGMNVQFLPRGGEGGPPAAAPDEFADIDVPAGEGSDDYLW
ncbi:MAG: single-stranded DNA-binding protein [Actinobacteria bacterium]|nr:single-stranded DNA-binding protein [Actinomycetota bacterium]MBU1943862.1 single-stranded DNA-binding protein [Actinomycetota bacterium]MBU2687683.1 single-stranded DNA-binding protein [Actinomycetota bacterium]